MAKQNLSSSQAGLVLLGCLAWFVAIVLYLSANDFKVEVQEAKNTGQSPAVAVAPNTKAGLASAGFAIAGGLCFLGMALTAGPAETARTPTPPPNP
jgi:hypothetical protein